MKKSFLSGFYINNYLNDVKAVYLFCMELMSAGESILYISACTNGRPDFHTKLWSCCLAPWKPIFVSEESCTKNVIVLTTQRLAHLFLASTVFTYVSAFSSRRTCKKAWASFWYSLLFYWSGLRGKCLNAFNYSYSL